MDNKEFISAYNDVENCPSLYSVAQKLGLAIKTVKNKAAMLRNGGAELIYRSKVTPMSEDEDKFHQDWTREQCMEELRRIAEMDLEMVVTRNYFRNHSTISESTWSRHFGTFSEFKRQTGITLTRQQHQLERNLAKHASVDHYRKIGQDRTDWAEKYLRPNKARYQTIAFASDIHDKEADPFFLRVFVDTIKRAQPDVVCLVGDIFDLPEFGRYGVDPREWDVVGRIRHCHEEILAPIREACPEAQIDFIEGNHEARLLRMLADATPALRAVLSDLHGFSVSKLLGLDKFEINYIAKADLAAWTVRDQNRELGNNYKVYFDSVLAHHFPHARNMGLPGVNGHHHRHQVWPMFSPTYGAYEWHQLGCGHRRSASYTEGEKWHMGFALANIDIQNQNTSFDYIPVTDFAVSGGKWYEREVQELL